MWIRTLDGKWYVHEVRGGYLSWVSEKDNARAAVFPDSRIFEWIVLMESMSDLRLQAVTPFV